MLMVMVWLEHAVLTNNNHNNNNNWWSSWSSGVNQQGDGYIITNDDVGGAQGINGNGGVQGANRDGIGAQNNSGFKNNAAGNVGNNGNNIINVIHSTSKIANIDVIDIIAIVHCGEFNETVHKKNTFYLIVNGLTQHLFITIISTTMIIITNIIMHLSGTLAVVTLWSIIYYAKQNSNWNTYIGNVFYFSPISTVSNDAFTTGL